VKGAAETIRENNVLGGCCARVCPYDHLCEEACSRTSIDKPIHIGKLQRFAIEQEKLFDMKTLVAGPKKDVKVACVGSGPASLACAAKLATEGYDVTIYEAFEKAGGVLTYGIIPSRLPQDVVDHDIKMVADLGVKFVFNTKVGKDITIDELKKNFSAIFVGAGLWASNMVDIKGMDLDGVTNAVDFLKAARSANGNFETGKEVIVIGGGDVAMDCAATAKLLGADKVTIVYRRTIEEAPANINELAYVQGMGITIVTKFRPAEVLGDTKVTGMAFDGTDGFSGLKLKADTVVFAIGQGAEDMSKIASFKLNEKGAIVADPEAGLTSVEGLFAAGDIVNGGKTVVEAVAQGKAAADSIIKYLNMKVGVK
jgi:dihydropyrimidine dehydrogenase (NAD+) subunit PreT